MQCPKCGSEKFDVVRVWRNRRYSAEKRRVVVALDGDLRKLLCAECGSVYYSESRLVACARWDEGRLRTVMEPMLRREPSEGF